jgi:hypothetical protein
MTHQKCLTASAPHELPASLIACLLHGTRLQWLDAHVENILLNIFFVLLIKSETRIVESVSPCAKM